MPTQNNTPNALKRQVTLLLCSTLTVMAGATIAPSLPQITEVFQDHDHAEFWVKLILTAPALFIALGGPVSGMIIDRFGRKKLLVFSLLLYGLAGSTGYYLSSLEGILLGRAFLGLGVSGVMTTTLTLISDYYQGTERNRMMGLLSSFMALGGVIFLLLGGVLADIHWRMPFLIYFFAFLLIPLVLYSLEEPQVIRESPAEDKAHFLKELPLRTMALVYGIGFLGMAVFYLIPVQLPFYMKHLGPVSNTQIGLAISCNNLFSGLISMQYSRARMWFSFPAVFAIMFLLAGLGYLAIANAHDYSGIVWSLIFAGLGLGLMMPNLNVLLAGKTPEPVRGRVVGGLTSALFLGQFFSPLLSQPVYQTWGPHGVFAASGLLFILLGLVFTGITFHQGDLNL